MRHLHTIRAVVLIGVIVVAASALFALLRM